nr:unnamed protein product [Callosobruchus chinensis]
MSNRPISVVEFERRRLTTAASLSKDLETITACGSKNKMKFRDPKPSILHGKSWERFRKYFSPSNLLTPYKAQIRPSLEYCSHIWGAAAPTSLAIPDAVQRRAVWARAHQGWLLPQWRNVLFSDESKFGLVSDDYRERVWREGGEQNRLATAIGVAPYRGGT